MKLTIDQSILDKNNLTLAEFLLLYIGANNIDIKATIESLVAKGLADKDLFTPNNVVVSDNVKELLSSITIDSDKNIIDKDEEYLKLASEMREIYPSGKKAGTTYLWRGNTAEVAKKLKTLVVKYHYTLNKEEVLKATKEYVNSFNGDYKYMQLLKYFILKSVRDADGNVEIKSELMTLIENADQIEEQKNDWISTLT